MVISKIAKGTQADVFEPIKRLSRDMRRKYYKVVSDAKVGSKCPKCRKLARMYLYKFNPETFLVMCEHCGDGVATLPVDNEKGYEEYDFVKLKYTKEEIKHDEKRSN